ncbi:STAS domain-containing protein [Candidatus Fermentibacteria bacterium]|nr:STAS domain-containing protein [Candidatus Fermentibacteria bacterium]
MASKLEVTKEEMGDIVVFSVKGAVDAATVNTFDGVLGPAFRSRNVRGVVDCSQVTYICSHAMGLLIEYHRQSCLGTGRIVVCAPSRSVASSLKRLRIDAILTVVPTRADALEELAAQG